VPSSSQFRSRHFDKKPPPKQVDLVTGSKLGERQQKINKGSYIQNSNKPFQHEFQVIEGTIDKDTPEYASFQRVY